MKNENNDKIISYTKRRPLWIYAVLSISAAFLLNAAILCSGLLAYSPAYMEITRDNQPITALVFIASCILMPIMEEGMFRIILYNQARRFLKPGYSIILTSALFGLYHLNLIQFIYGFLMGCIFAGCYEKDHRVAVPVIMHVTANTAVMFLRLI